MPPAAAFATLPRNVAIVAVFNAAIAIALSLSGRGPLGESMVYSQCIGFIALLSVDVPRRLMWPGRMPPRLPMLVLSSAGMLAGFAGGVSLAAVISTVTPITMNMGMRTSQESTMSRPLPTTPM